MPLNRDYRIKNAIQLIEDTYGDVVSVDAKKKNLIKFGRNENVGSSSFETIWNQGGTETHATGNDIDSISSSNAGDTQTVSIEGHTLSGSDLTFVVQSATLNGQTPVTLGTSLYRTSRMYNTGSTDFAGDVYVFESGGTVTGGVPQTSADIHLKATGADNQSLKCATSLSSVDYLIITQVVGNANRNSNARNVDFRLQVREYGKTFRTLLPFSSANYGGSAVINLDQPIIVPPNSDIRVTAQASGSTTIVSASFHGYLAIIQ